MGGDAETKEETSAFIVTRLELGGVGSHHHLIYFRLIKFILNLLTV